MEKETTQKNETKCTNKYLYSTIGMGSHRIELGHGIGFEGDTMNRRCLPHQYGTLVLIGHKV